MVKARERERERPAQREFRQEVRPWGSWKGEQKRRTCRYRTLVKKAARSDLIQEKSLPISRTPRPAFISARSLFLRRTSYILIAPCPFLSLPPFGSFSLISARTAVDRVSSTWEYHEVTNGGGDPPVIRNLELIFFFLQKIFLAEIFKLSVCQ